MTILDPFSVYPTVNLTKGVMDFGGRLKYGLLLVLALVQCKEEEKPEGLLPKEEMINLMVDVYLAEARISILSIPRDSAVQLFYPYEDSLLRKRGLSDSLLMANYQYYLGKPKELESILDAVIDTLNLREQRLKDQPY